VGLKNPQKDLLEFVHQKNLVEHFGFTEILTKREKELLKEL